MKKLMVGLLIVLLSGCVGYQNVRVYEREDDIVVLKKQIKALIIGTSGQAVDTGDVKIEKKDTSDKATELVQDGISAGIAIASKQGDLT